MLDGLDEIDWSSLTHAYGPATDVPDLLRGLASPDADVRQNAGYELFGNIWHQGTIYDATVPAIPFLFELLTAPATPDRDLVALLIACIADGRGYFEVHATGDRSDARPWSGYFRKRGTTLEEERKRETDRVSAVHQAISPRLALLLPYLIGAPDVRECVAVAIARYPECRQETLPALESALATEPDEHVREVMQQAVATLRGAAEQD